MACGQASLFVVLVLVTVILPGCRSPASRPRKVTQYFADKADEIIVTYVGGLAMVAVLFWLGRMWRFMRTAGQGPMLATSAVAVASWRRS